MEKHSPEAQNSLRLSEAEKNAMRSVLEAHMRANPPGLIRSPWHFLFSVPSFTALAALLLFSGTSFGAYKAIPGEALYPVKVYINEPIQLMLATTPAARARIALQLAERRIAEAKALQEQNALDERTAAELEQRFGMHISAAISYKKEAGELRPEETLLATFHATPFQIYASVKEAASTVTETVTDTATVPASEHAKGTAKSMDIDSHVPAPTVSVSALAATTTPAVRADTILSPADTNSFPAVSPSTDDEDTDATGVDENDSEDNEDTDSPVQSAVSDTVDKVKDAVKLPVSVPGL